MSSWPGPSCGEVLERAGGLELGDRVGAGAASARSCPRARCIARPTSAISSPTPVAASEIRTWASAAEYCALMTSFLVRKASIFGAQLLLGLGQLLLLGLELGDLLVERLQLGLGDVLALERGPRELLVARPRAPGAPGCRA